MQAKTTKYTVTHPTSVGTMTTEFDTLARAIAFAGEVYRNEFADGLAGKWVEVTIKSWEE